jgi:hypothetical protein
MIISATLVNSKFPISKLFIYFLKKKLCIHQIRMTEKLNEKKLRERKASKYRSPQNQEQLDMYIRSENIGYY